MSHAKDGSKFDANLGWDFVYAAGFFDVNTEIEAAKSTPTDFERDNGLEVTDSNYRKIEGNFADAAHTKGHWQMTTGGSGEEVWMKMPDIDFRYTKGQDAPVSYTDCTLKVSFRMEFRDSNRNGPRGGKVMQLRIRTAKTTGSNEDVVTIEDYSSTPSPTTLDEITITGLFANWLEDNLDQFDHTFAEVVVDGFAEHERFQWLQPTSLGYAVNQTDEDDPEADGFMVISAMTGGATPPGPTVPVRSVLPRGKRRSFAISSRKYLEHLLLPGMGYMFSDPQDPAHNWPSEYFDVVGNTMITNTKPLVLNQLSYDSEKLPVDATIPANRFTAVLAGNFLTIEMSELQHPYYIGETEIDYLDTFHTFRSFATVRLNDQNQFDLIPYEDESLKEVAYHKAHVQKTQAAQVVEWLIVLADVLIILKGVGALASGWLAAEETGAEVGEEAAEQAMVVVEEGAVDEGAVQNIEEEGGEAALETAAEGGWALNTLWAQYGTTVQAVAGCLMTAGLAAEYFFEKYADGSAKEKLPKFEEFAAQVMEPVAWTATGGGMDVDSVIFNDGFQAFEDDAG